MKIPLQKLVGEFFYVYICRIKLEIMKKWLAYYLNIDEPQTAFERVMKIVAFILAVLVVMVGVIFYICYFMFGLFILDGLYYIITGKTIVYKTLN